MRPSRLPYPALFVAFAIALAGCGSEKKASAPATTGRRASDGLTTAAPATTAAASATTAAYATTAAPASRPGPSVASETADSDGGSSARVTTAMPATTAAAASKASGTSPRPPTPAPKQQEVPLRAGSVDDNADLGAFLKHMSDLQQEGIAFRQLNPEARITVSVVDKNGRPASGAQVKVTTDQQTLTTLTATADGTIRYYPQLYGGPFHFSVGNNSVKGTPNANLKLAIDEVVQPGNKLDIVFAIDATGSMGDEIDRLKASVDTIASRVSSLPGQPDLRMGMTIYRDKGDEFVTRNTDLTSDIQSFRRSLAKVEAGGGGDVPEALDEGLSDALNAQNWRPAGSATQLVFLIGDAGPHVDRQVPHGYNDSAIAANARGIKIFPIASSNSDDLAEGVFRQLAQYTGARFVFLSYGANGAATGDSTDIAKADYQELSLDDLIVRLVAEEVAARNDTALRR
jgi:von Willebrand factor type A domain